VATHSVRLDSPPPDSPGAALERRVECLGQIGLLEPLGTALLNRLAAGSEERLYASGERVVRQDDPGASMFVIVSGRVEVTAVAAGRDRGAVLAVLGPGDYFGEMSLMTGAPRVATVTAVEETRLIEVGKESFAVILAAEPALVEELGRALQRRMTERAQAVAGTGREAPEAQDILRKIRTFFGA
jgi:CRP-like cAMP-binding protein